LTLQENFEPDILGFLCNWCSYAGADLAGVSRFQYPPNVRIIRVMCSARVDPTIVLEAFIRGLDGVMVLGCHLGDCHYMTGNYYTERIRKLGSLGNETDLEPQQLRTRLVAAKEALTQDRIRWLVGRERELVEDKNVFGEKVSQEEFDQLIFQTIEKEFAKRRILLSMGEDALSVMEIAQIVEASPRKVLRNMVSLERDGLVSVVGIEGNSPKYQRTRGS
jgi:F420-non-reducing hydrogenase iron-sulfur subunit